MKTALFRVTFATALLAAGYTAGRLSPEPVAEAAQTGRIFEMRTYTTNEGKLPALQTRFRDHTLGFFKKYDMTSIGYWVPAAEQRLKPRWSTSWRTRAAKRRRRTGESSARTRNGRKLPRRPRSTERSWPSRLNRFSSTPPTTRQIK